MKTIVIIFFWILVFASWPAKAAPLKKTDHLFWIERNKNKNCVQYDVRLLGNSDLPDSNPVTVYWILENGEKEELSPIQRKYAYGIDSQEKLEKNRFRIILTAVKNREIIVEKINGFYKALVLIGGKQSILEKVFIESKERLTGLPQVLYVDLFGRTQEANLPVKERIICK